MTFYHKISCCFIIVFGLMGSFTSCIKEYDPGFGDHISKLVVNAVFSPDSVFVVKVSQSKSTVDTNSLDYISGVTVELFEDGTKIETLTEKITKDTTYSYDPLGGEEILIINDQFHYESSIKPIAEKNYSIRAAKDGFETVTAESSVPKGLESISINTSEMKVTEYVYEGGFSDTYIEGPLFIDLVDEAGVENFYEFKLFYIYTDSIFSYELVNEEWIPTFERMQTNRYEVYASVSDGTNNLGQSDDFSLDAPLEQFSDVRYDGQTNRFTLNDFNISYNDLIDYKIELEVGSLSKEYYNYFTSYEKYRYTEGNFLAEPVIVFNNSSYALNSRSFQCS